MSISKLHSKADALEQQENVESTKAGGPALAAVAAGGDNLDGEVQSAQRAATNKAGTKTKLHSPNTASKYTQQQQQQPQPPPPPQPQPQPQQTNLPQTSLLKIEPFVPSLNTRLRRPFGRSYSTLSAACNKRTTTIGAPSLNSPLTGAAIDVVLPKKGTTTTTTPSTTRNGSRQRRNPVRVVTRQRSKSTSSSASNRPTTATATATATATTNGNHTFAPTNTATIANGPNAGGAIVTAQPNGICRIIRLPHEKEKLPDRINYDRRGLTAIPIFEQEPNLRLLSLQHNLINIFHIPKEPEPHTTDTKANGSAQSQTSVNRVSDECISGSPTNQSGSHFGGQSSPRHNQPSAHISAQQVRTNACCSSNNINNIRLPYTNLGTSNLANGLGLRLRSITPPPIAPPSSPLTTHALPMGHGGAHVSHLLHLSRSTLIQKNFNYHSPLLPITHQPAGTPYRFGMKRSKSFVTNYARHLQNMKHNLQQAYLAKAEATQLKSFDSGTGSGLTNTDSTSTLATTSGHSELEEENPLQQLEIKNKQLLASYGMIFQHLVFLDLYDNQIERIGNLEGLPALSVLLLGKNRLTDISGLRSLRQTLRVLDLHGNKISNISNKINCLQELKSLNLAGNQIRQINQNDFSGLLNLKELNLKRNKIKRIHGFQHLTALERLWLCHNDLHKVEDMASIAKAINLLEVTVENNPVSLAGDCVSFLVSYLPQLQTLSQMPITEQVRRAAMAWRKNKEISDANYSQLSTDAFNSIKREEVISNARTNWELLRSQQLVQVNGRTQQRSSRQPELAKINESNEALVGLEEMQELIKLPLIQQQQPQQQQQQEPNDNNAPATEALQDGTTQHSNGARLSGSSGSSLGPNVDSSSSCYSSDIEESPKLQTQRARVKKCQKAITTRGDGGGGGAAGRQRKTVENDGKVIANDNAPVGGSDETVPLLETVAPNAITTKQTVSLKANVNAATTATTATTITAATTQAVKHENPADNKSSIVNKSNANKTLQQPPTTDDVVLTMSTASATAAMRCTTANQATGFNSAETATTTTSTSTKTATLTTAQATAQTSVTIATTTTTTTITAASTRTTCRRYTQGTLTRSQTIVGGAGNGNSPNTVTNVANEVNSTNATSRRIHSSYANKTSNNNAQSAPTVTCIVAPTPLPAAATAANSNNSKAATTGNKQSTTTASEREKEQGGDYLIEICGRYLNVYGQGALRYIDKQWNPTKANDVHTLNFSYINFNNIAATVLSRIKLRFPHAENFVFRETNISCLGQLNALAELQGITSLSIDPEGNVITTKDLWRQYAIYRLSHWGLKLLNGVEVTEAMVNEANDMYAGLSDLVLWAMPEVMLQPLLARLRLDETCTASKMSPKEWLMKSDNKSLRLVVGKEALQWKKSTATTAVTTTCGNSNFFTHQQAYAAYDAGGMRATSLSTTGATAAPLAANNAALSMRERGKLHFALMLENTCNAVEKLHQLETLWPSLLLDIVRNTLLDYSQLDEYLSNLMSEIMK